MRRLDNPPNPYESTYHEWLEPPPAVKVEVYQEEARSILSENDSPDVGFRWSVNPYRGCQHGCCYCYARPTHEYLGFGAGSDFETRLVVKVNAAELLDEELRRPAWVGELIAFSGVTDCYQPLEAVWGITRACLEVCLRFRNPISMVTKSYLVMRDVDILRSLLSECSASVMLSIPFSDVATARLVEPGAPTPDRRFEAMRLLADAGVPVGILVGPIVPGLNDQDIPRLLARAADCGATCAYYEALRLPGSVAPVFLSRMRNVMPLRADRIEHRLREIRDGRLSDCRFGERMTGRGTYWESVEQLFEISARKHHLDRPFRDACSNRFRVPPSTRTGVQLELPFGE